MDKHLDRLFDNMERMEKQVQDKWATERGYSSHSDFIERRDRTIARNNAKRRGLR